MRFKTHPRAKKPTQSKYGNVRTTNADGEKFDSKLEAKVYADLCAEHAKANHLKDKHGIAIELIRK